MHPDNQQIIENATTARDNGEITQEQYADAILLAMTNEADMLLESEEG